MFLRLEILKFKRKWKNKTGWTRDTGEGRREGEED